MSALQPSIVDSQDGVQSVGFSGIVSEGSQDAESVNSSRLDEDEMEPEHGEAEGERPESLSPAPLYREQNSPCVSSLPLSVHRVWDYCDDTPITSEADLDKPVSIVFEETETIVLLDLPQVRFTLHIQICSRTTSLLLTSPFLPSSLPLSSSPICRVVCQQSFRPSPTRCASKTATTSRSAALRVVPAG